MDLLQLSNEDRAFLTSREKFSRRVWVFCSDGDKFVDDSRLEFSISFQGNASKLRRVLFEYSSSSFSDMGECSRLGGLTASSWIG